MQTLLECSDIFLQIVSFLATSDQARLARTTRLTVSAVHLHRQKQTSLSTTPFGESPFDFVALLPRLPRLTTVDVSYCAWLHNVGDDFLTALALACPLLVHVNVAGLPSISNRGCEALATHCPALAYVDVTYTATTYEAVLILRRYTRDAGTAAPAPVVVRRQPTYVVPPDFFLRHTRPLRRLYVQEKLVF